MSQSLPISFVPLLVHGLAGPARARLALHQQVAADSFLSDIPTCAFDCIIGFAAVSFPDCAVEDLDCQCVSQSQSGFTIGEGALRCLVSDCSGESTSVLENMYQACLNVAGAQPETHGTITASMAKPSTIMLPNPQTPTSITSPTTTPQVQPHSTHATSRKAPHSSHSTSAAHTLATALSTTSSGAQPSSAPITQSAGATAPVIAPLNNAQIAGIVVSSVIIAAILAGLLLCVFCARRKKRRRESDISFGNGSGGPELPKTPRLEDGFAKPESKPRRLTLRGIPANPKQKRWTLWRLAMMRHKNNDDTATTAEQYGSGFWASRHSMMHETSPLSAKSYHTTSQLLPDKPVFDSRFPLPIAASFGAAPKPEQSLPPIPVAAEAVTLHSSPATTIPGRKPIRITENGGVRLITPTPPGSQQTLNSRSQPLWKEENAYLSSLQPKQALRHQASDPFIDRGVAQRGPEPPLNLQRGSTRDLPKLETSKDRSVNNAASTLIPIVSPTHSDASQLIPPPHRQRSGPFSLLSQSHVSPQPSPNGGNAETADPFATLSISSGLVQRAPPVSNEPKFSKWAPIKPQNHGNARPLTHYTNGSDTSFEDEDVTPPTASGLVVTLSPVAESPVAKALPGRGQQYYYPPVPGSGLPVRELRISPQRQQPRPPQEQSPTRAPPPRNQSRPVLAVIQKDHNDTGSGLRALDQSDDTAQPPQTRLLDAQQSAPPTKIPQPSGVTYTPLNRPVSRPLPIPTRAAAPSLPRDGLSTNKSGKTPPSPSSPNFSRPQRPEEYRAATAAVILSHNGQPPGVTGGHVAADNLPQRQRGAEQFPPWLQLQRQEREERVRREQERLWREREAREARERWAWEEQQQRERNQAAFRRESRPYAPSYGYQRGSRDLRDIQLQHRGPWRGRQAPIGAQWRE